MKPENYLNKMRKDMNKPFNDIRKELNNIGKLKKQKDKKRFVEKGRKIIKGCILEVYLLKDKDTGGYQTRERLIIPNKKIVKLLTQDIKVVPIEIKYGGKE